MRALAEVRGIPAALGLLILFGLARGGAAPKWGSVRLRSCADHGTAREPLPPHRQNCPFELPIRGLYAAVAESTRSAARFKKTRSNSSPYPLFAPMWFRP